MTRAVFVDPLELLNKGVPFTSLYKMEGGSAKASAAQAGAEVARGVLGGLAKLI